MRLSLPQKHIFPFALRILALVSGTLCFAYPSMPQSAPPSAVLFQNVRVFSETDKLSARVKCIDHGQLLDDATAKLMADKGIWWSLQPFTDDHLSPYPEGSFNRTKQLTMYAGTDTAYGLAKKYRIKTAWGTDILFDTENLAAQNQQLTKMVKWYTPAEVLKMVTADNAELLALSGPRTPSPGKRGVVEQGALADLLLADGDPIANSKLLEDPAKNLLVIRKDGKVYKNTLSGEKPR